MQTSTDHVYVVTWDQHGWGRDTVLGVYYDEYVAYDQIDLMILKFSKGRYDRADFLVQRKEVY